MRVMRRIGGSQGVVGQVVRLVVGRVVVQVSARETTDSLGGIGVVPDKAAVVIRISVRPTAAHTVSTVSIGRDEWVAAL